MNQRARFVLPPADVPRMHAAVAAWQHGDFASAAAGYRELAELHPLFADVRHFYGLLLFQQGAHKPALAMLDAAQRLDPDNLDFLRNFGRVLREMGNYVRSIVCLKRAWELDPEHVPTLVSLARSLLAVNCGDDAIADLERHLDAAGDDWRLWMLLGECREQGGDREGALAAYVEGSQRAPPNNASARIMRGEEARRTSEPELAEREYRAALAIDPESANAELGLAHLASERGNFARAQELLESAVKHRPDLYGAWQELSHVVAATPDFVDRLDAAIARAGEDGQAWPLYFARAHAQEALGDYDRAFADYERGNRMCAVSNPDKPEARLDYARNLIANLDGAFLKRTIAAPSADRPNAIFICGMPRSGTTLVETILAAHPDVNPGGEQRYIHDRLRHRLGRENVIRIGSWLRECPDADLAELARDWGSSLTELAAGHARVTDKMPTNYYLLGLIHVCFPDAPIIHVKRDARDTCFSCFATPFTVVQEFSHTLAGTARAWRLYERLMQHWRETLGPERIIEIEYERLVQGPEVEIRRLLAALDLDWDARCLDFHRVSRTVRTASVHQVRQPLYTSSIGRWQHFEAHLGPLFEALEEPAQL